MNRNIQERVAIMKDIRKKLGKSQAEVATAINMDRSYYSRKECETSEVKFNQSEIQKIMDYLIECDKEFNKEFDEKSKRLVALTNDQSRISVRKMIVELKKKAGMRQEDIGEVIGINRANVSRWSRGLVDVKLSHYTKLVNLYIDKIGKPPTVKSSNSISDIDLVRELEKRGWDVTLSANQVLSIKHKK